MKIETNILGDFIIKSLEKSMTYKVIKKALFEKIKLGQKVYFVVTNFDEQGSIEPIYFKAIEYPISGYDVTEDIVSVRYEGRRKYFQMGSDAFFTKEEALEEIDFREKYLEDYLIGKNKLREHAKYEYNILQHVCDNFINTPFNKMHFDDVEKDYIKVSKYFSIVDYYIRVNLVLKNDMLYAFFDGVLDKDTIIDCMQIEGNPSSERLKEISDKIEELGDNLK